MSVFYKTIYFIVLCSFTFTTSAVGVLCSLSMPEHSNTQQNPVDIKSKKCHDENKLDKEQASADCCHDMNSCGNSISMPSNIWMSSIEIVHNFVKSTSNEVLVFRSLSPPVPPPKSIS
jgi:hypothetical protein